MNAEQILRICSEFRIRNNSFRVVLHSKSSKKGQANASVAQLVEQGTENPRVVGSIPTGGTKKVIEKLPNMRI